MIKFSPLEIQVLNACFEKRPELKLFLEKHGDQTLEQYASDLIPQSTKITETFKKITHDLMLKYTDLDAANTTTKTFNTISAIDTSGHGGIISEDCALQGHMIISEGVRRLGLEHFLSFSCGVVPMNNITWPRGFYIGGERISLFSKSVDRLAFHEAPSFSKEQIEKRLMEGGIHNKAVEIFEWIKTLPNIYNYKNFYEQCVIINSELWNNNFRRNKQDPKFTQLMLEEVTSELVIDALQNDPEFINFIFDKAIIEKLLNDLSDLPGTWNKDMTKGTFLFWHVSGDFRSSSMFLSGEKLKGKGLEIEFNCEDLITNLKAKKIIPSVFLSLLMLVKHGVRSLGGYHQCWYLPQYICRLKRIVSTADNISLTFLQNSTADDLMQLGYGIGFYKSINNHVQLAGLETFYNNIGAVQEAYKYMENITVSDGVRSALKKWYLEIVPVNERKLPIDEMQ